MSATLLSRFQRGERLVIRPVDTDDPEANKMAGVECFFVRYGNITDLAIVEFKPKGQPFYFRTQDLQRAEVQR